MTVSAATTAGQILTSAYVNNNINSGLDYITETSGSAVSSLSVNSCFTSTYTNYRIVGNVTVAATAGNLGFRYRIGGVDNSSANYTWVVNNLSSSGGTPATSVTGQQAATVANFAYKTTTATHRTGFVLDIFSPQIATGFKSATGQSTNASGSIDIYNGGFALAVEAAFDGFSFISASGTMSLSAKIYGYRQA
jgi:hypothetical protein